MDRVRYLFGLLTLGIAAIGGWYLVGLLSDEDARDWFRLDVEFRTARGLTPGAHVRYRGVVVGSVRDVSLRPDGSSAVVRVVLFPGREELVATNSKVWIVTPRFSGLARGATGLETLVRDAYVAMQTPVPAGPALADGSSLAGLESPYFDPADAPLPPTHRGDLLMTLLVPENHGLDIGSPIKFRGVTTGELRSIRLAPDGTHIELQVRIERSYRSTVTDRSKFWVARPSVSGALTGFSIRDVSALISPFLAYYTPPGGLPVRDGFRAAASRDRPKVEVAEVPAASIRRGSPMVTPETAEQRGLRLVRISYGAVEVDTFSANDKVSCESTGLLYERADGELAVLTTRTACDGAYFVRDVFGGDPEIEREEIRVQLPDGPVLRALRTWVAEDGSDLAVLSVQTDANTRNEIPVTPADRFAFGEELAIDGMRELGAGASPRPRMTVGGQALPVVAEHRAAVLLAGERIVAVLGQQGGTDKTPRAISISGLPTALRPSQ